MIWFIETENVLLSHWRNELMEEDFLRLLREEDIILVVDHMSVPEVQKHFPLIPFMSGDALDFIPTAGNILISSWTCSINLWEGIGILYDKETIAEEISDAR